MTLLLGPLCRLLALVGSKLDSGGTLRGTIRYFSEMEAPPSSLVEALVAAEDQRFALHNGVDFFACARALRAQIVTRRLEGGSTIEQQLVRTVTADYRICFSRKIREMCLAAHVSREFSKQAIAIAYLNCAYFGNELIGHRSASRALLESGIHTVEDCALLIAALKIPYSPSEATSISERRFKRRRRILLTLEAFECAAQRAKGSEVGIATVAGPRPQILR